MTLNIITEKDINDCMEMGDLAVGHAIESVANFLKSIATSDDTEINPDHVVIEKMTTPEDHPEDTISELELEMAITSELRKIGEALITAADSRDLSNSRIINGLKELISR